MLAAQLFTLRDFVKTPADIAQTLKKVKKIGYNAVQLSALGKVDPKELAGMLQGEGLTCCATHVGLDRLRTESKQVIEEHQMWGCQLTAIGGFFPPEPYSKQLWTDFVTTYNNVAKLFAGSNLRIGYHNHSHELSKVDGTTPLQMLVEGLDSSIWMEIDTYWITHGGADPSAWIKKVAGRIPAVHLKDMSIRPNREQKMAPVGDGNLNWPGILATCKEAGVKYYIVEQDDCNGLDPFDCLATSYRNLRAMGLS